MKKILAVSLLAVGLAGCNAATTTTVYTRPAPVAVVQYPPLPPTYPGYRYRTYCYSVWDRTPYGMRERKVCR